MKPPYLTRAFTVADGIDVARFPFTLPAFARGVDIAFDRAVTFFVGENGSGKSTLLEAIAIKCGFNPAGGNRNHTYENYETESCLEAALRLHWKKKAFHGFFLRAETLFNFASYLDGLIDVDPHAFVPYGGVSLHQQSHGESFLALFENKFRDGIFLLDEPEAALSPSRQLALLIRINQLVTSGGAQFIIATHSPILFSYPEATVLQFKDERIERCDYREIEHFQLTKRFLEAPERYFRELFREDE